MAFEELEAQLSLDSSDFVEGTDEAEAATQDLGDSVGETSDSMFDVNRAGAVASGALAGIGTAAQRALDETKDLRSTLGQTALTMGNTRDEMMDLATSMSGASLPIEDATAAMKGFSELGVESRDRMEELVSTADNLGDATGSSAETIAREVAPVMRALDGDLESLTETQDALTLAVHNSSLEISDITSTISKLDFGKMQEMGLQTQELTGLIVQFQEETGFTGRQLRSNFRQAIDEADGSQQKLIENLGLSDDALEQWNGRVEESTGVTEEYAEANNEPLSAMDELRAKMDEVMLKTGDFLEPISAAAPAMQGLGAAGFALSTMNVTALAPSFGAVAAAAAPVTAVVLALAAAAAGLYYVWDNNLLGIRDTTQDVFGTVMDRTRPVVDLLKGEFMQTINVWKNGIMSAFELVQPYWEAHGDTVKDVLDVIIGAVGFYADMFIQTWVAIGRSLLAILRGDLDALDDIWGDWFDNISESWEGLTDEIFDVLPTGDEMITAGEDMMQALADGVKDAASAPVDAVEGVTDGVRKRLPGSDAEEGPLSDITDSFAAIPETAEEQMTDNADMAAEGARNVASAASTATAVDTDASAGGSGNSNVVIEFADGATEALWDVLEPFVEVTVDGETEKKARRSSLQSSLDPS